MAMSASFPLLPLSVQLDVPRVSLDGTELQIHRMRSWGVLIRCDAPLLSTISVPLPSKDFPPSFLPSFVWGYPYSLCVVVSFFVCQ